jgi:hypothetical protein
VLASGRGLPASSCAPPSLESLRGAESLVHAFRPQLVPRGLDATELVLATLVGEGLDLAHCLSAHLALMNYVRGTAVSLERDAQAEAETGLSDEAHLERQEPALQALLSGGDYPTFARLDAAGLSFDRGALFEAGLQLFLDGIAQRLARQDRCLPG